MMQCRFRTLLIALALVPPLLANGVLAQEPAAVPAESQIALLNALSIDRDKILAVARPDVARRLELTPAQTRQIQQLVLELAELQHGLFLEFPPLSKQAK